MVKIIYQQVTEDGKFVLGLEGLSSDTKPTGGVIADGSTFKETNTDAVYYLDTTWKLAKAGQLKELPTVSAGDNGKVMKVAEGAWALGADNGLPVGFPEAGLTNAGKFVGFNDTTGAYEAKSAPSGGAEKFVVTLTEDDSGAETVWTADKTVAEVTAAYEADSVIVASFTPPDGLPVEVPLQTEFEGTYLFTRNYNLGDGEAFVMVSASEFQEQEVWTVDIIQPEYVPSYSSSNDGQVLGVSSGDLAWVDVAPLIVTLNAQGVGDKTYGEAMTAAQAGRIVMFKSESAGVFLAQSIIYSSDEILIQTNASGFESISGGANDTIQHS